MFPAPLTIFFVEVIMNKKTQGGSGGAFRPNNDGISSSIPGFLGYGGSAYVCDCGQCGYCQQKAKT